MPVWDDFLTARDRAHLDLGRGKNQPFGLGEWPAIIVVDNFLESIGGEEETWQDAVAKAPFRFGADVLPALRSTSRLLSAARASGIPVIHTTVENPIPRGRFAAQALSGISFTFHPLSAPVPGEVVIRKTYASAFGNTGLAALLLARGVDSAIVCGNSTSGCVRATVVDAAAAGFFVAIVEECTFDRTEASHAMSLFDMDQKYGDVLSIDETIDYVQTHGVHSWSMP